MPRFYSFQACNARRNLRADEQEPHKRPTRRDELARHSEVQRFSRGGKWGGCAGSRSEAETACPQDSPKGGRSPATNAFLPGEIPPRKCGGKSAEVVVAEHKPGVRDPRKLETGNLETAKDRTDEEPLTTWRTSTPIKPVGQEVDESHYDGKHVELWGEEAWAERSKSPHPGRRELQP